MKITDQFKLATDFFDRQNLDYAVIGAFALYAYGYMRATKDIDFITNSAHQSKIVGYLESIGFETLHCSEAFSNHLHPIGSARIDMMYISGETAVNIFQSAQIKFIIEGIELPVVSPEHLLILKLFAAKSNPDRKFKELDDIKELVNRTEIDKTTVKHYFEKYGLEDYYDEIVEKKDV